MAKTKPKATQPVATKQELLKVINSCNRGESDRLSKLRADKVAAAEALETFQKTNAEYRRLLNGTRLADNRLNRAERDERARFNRMRREATNALYLKGPTPETIKLIEKLLRDFPNTSEDRRF